MEDNKLYLYNQFAINNVQEDDNIIKVDGYCCHYNKINLNHEMVDEKSFDAFFELYNANKLKPNHSEVPPRSYYRPVIRTHPRL